MTPYWQSSDGRLAIYHGACQEVLPTLTPFSADLLLTDPPYGVRWRSNFRNALFPEIVGDDSLDAARSGIETSLRILRPYRHLYVFGRMEWGDLPVTSPVELIWDKGNQSGGDVTLPWGIEHEYIQFGVYVPSQSNRDTGYGRLSARLRQGSILRAPRINGVAVQRHPTEKPVRLLRQLIESSSCLDEVVLDPFMGSGSTGEAAQREDRHFIGIEIEERYCEIAARRLEDPPMLAAVKAEQGDLFAESTP